ncbi:MAG: hypothetical protein ABIV26_05275 [Candidatus Limnocylindrales bacterium]
MTLPTPGSATPTPIEPAAPPSVWLTTGVEAMTITDSLRLRSLPSTGDDSLIYQPVLPQRARFRIAEGPVSGSGYWWYRVVDLATPLGDVHEGWVASADFDGGAWIAATPEACQEFQFPAAAPRIATLAELQDGFAGTWGGCVTTPWVPPYWVTVEFHADETYDATSQPIQLGQWQAAFYHGSDTPNAAKRYHLDDVLDDGTGSGEIDITFDTGSVVRGELRNIVWMGDRLDFEFFHFGTIGPISFQLVRLPPAG